MKHDFEDSMKGKQEEEDLIPAPLPSKTEKTYQQPDFFLPLDNKEIVTIEESDEMIGLVQSPILFG